MDRSGCRTTANQTLSIKSVRNYSPGRLKSRCGNLAATIARHRLVEVLSSRDFSFDETGSSQRLLF